MAQVLNLDALKQAELKQSPFPYLIVDNLLHKEAVDEVVKSFPLIDQRGSFPLNSISCEGKFAALMEEMQGDALKKIIAEKFDMDLEEKCPMITVRGYTTERDGHIHVDSSSKLVTILLYLNPNWTDPKGRLRLLYDHKNLSPYAAEVAPEVGRCLIFKVTKNCWHGHEVFVGPRRSIQLNYVASQQDKERHLNRHRFSAWMKRLFSGKKSESPSY
jgi:SM-20-related protein